MNFVDEISLKIKQVRHGELPSRAVFGSEKDQVNVQQFTNRKLQANSYLLNNISHHHV